MVAGADVAGADPVVVGDDALPPDEHAARPKAPAIRRAGTSSRAGPGVAPVRWWSLSCLRCAVIARYSGPAAIRMRPGTGRHGTVV